MLHKHSCKLDIGPQNDKLLVKVSIRSCSAWGVDCVGKISIVFFFASVIKALGFHAILQNEHIYFYLPSSVSRENCSFQEHKACLKISLLIM